ncbi:MAG: T9SS C-terminal target domain-containing protein [Calditrichaeota bacterium]|nr:MAG: T9SS C-terminal target domain-containing protein [Calditrichota bacterium]MBL1206262.1 T9SS C-terminal target domain-containing protein [Calditrichota bacterium]NOG46088.1 T9SS type A sorting domain-containing protein [Calditrichota bacterium]
MNRAISSGRIWRPLIIFVSAFLFMAGQLLADDSEFETEGYIQSIGADSLVVNGFIFDVTNHTEIEDDDSDYASFSDFRVGDYVEVKGRAKGNGRFYAEKIKRESKSDDDYEDDEDDDDYDHELETEGLISEIGDSTITVNSYTFIVTANTRIKAEHDLRLVFADLRIGMDVKVEGYWHNDSSLIATKIKLRNHDDDDDDNEVEFSGTIDSVLSDAIAINNHIIHVNDRTLIELRHDVLGEFSDLHAGMYVEVKAVVFDSNLIAIRIKVEDDESKIEITGIIDSVGNDFIKLLGYHVNIDDRTEITNHNHDSLGIADLEKGLRVKVKGRLTGDHIIHARRIKVKRFHDREVEFTGTITFLADDQIQVEQTLFFVDSMTVVMDDNHNIITFDQLSVGQLVEIKGYFRSDGNLWAVRIKVEDRNRDEIEFTGFIEFLSTDSITVNEYSFFVDSNTVVLDLQGNPISYDSLSVGDLVEIKGLLQADGSFYAVKIELENRPGLMVVSGLISAISSDHIWIDGPQYKLTESSVILDNNYKPTDLSQYQPGDDVTLWAIENATGSPQLLQSKLGTNALTSITDPNENRNLPEVFDLKSNYPNPFNPETTISFTIGFDGFRLVKLDVFDISGRKVKTLFSGLLNAGSYNFQWKGNNEFGNNVASGLYIYRLSTGANTFSRKMTLIR